MRWERLFEDLEAQWEGEERWELDSEIADRTRRARAEVMLLDRLGAHAGRPDAPLGLRIVTGEDILGQVLDVGEGWLLMSTGAAGRAVVPIAALVAVTGLDTRVVSTRTARRFGLGYALRGLSRDRAVVTVTDLSGGRSTGTIDAVGADALDLSEHPADEVRRGENLRGRRTIPFSALACVRSI